MGDRAVLAGLSMKVTANNGVNRSAKQHRSLVPVALCAPTPGYAERYADSRAT